MVDPDEVFDGGLVSSSTGDAVGAWVKGFKVGLFEGSDSVGWLVGVDETGTQ